MFGVWDVNSDKSSSEDNHSESDSDFFASDSDLDQPSITHFFNIFSILIWLMKARLSPEKPTQKQTEKRNSRKFTEQTKQYTNIKTYTKKSRGIIKDHIVNRN